MFLNKTTKYTLSVLAYIAGQLNPNDVVDIASFSSGKAGIQPILK